MSDWAHELIRKVSTELKSKCRIGFYYTFQSVVDH